MAATSAVKPAIKAVVYRNTGTYGSPTWTAIDFVRDANIGKPWDFGDASIRATRVKLYHPTQMDIAPSLTVRCDDANAGYLALESSANSGSPIELLILDGPIATEGVRGVRASFHVSDTGQDQAIGNVLYKNFELKPAFSTDAYPKYVVTGSGSALTETAPGA